MPTNLSLRNKRIQWNLSLARPIVTLSVGVLLPVLLSTATGIVAIVIGESSVTLILGILTVSFMAAAIGGAIIVYVLLGRRARLARLQSDLLGNVSHELRTPLAAIRIWAQTLQSREVRTDPQRAEAALDTILRETEWLEAMIDRILSWRAAARDRGLIDTMRRPLEQAATEAADRFRRMVPEDEVTFTFTCETRLMVDHDARAITQAVLNLLMNSYKYSTGHRVISLDVRDEAPMVRLSVEDKGIGIPPAELERIFEPFHRVKEGSTLASGAGLGLAIVHHAVKAHGGRITVESAVGRGSRFSLLLPAAPATGEA